ncbi:Asp-tRNA(Asn)/Glu-tRNA(Gln) amidotransferase subunit GatB [Candidatus Saccharibacteria bacterium]|nr:Asp-tRNA(Asn)/Glu-tRNA(Gln) amidotransferase subunit GatB [Candidatus Saccharibacteria bacterium]
MSISDYTPTVGIETHVQLKTKTKLFAAVGNDARQAAPNTLISHICVGVPGALPVLNEAAIELCARAALALGTEPQKLSHFERKHYFYPDLPKGYQITQYESPIIAGGHLHIEVDDLKKCISIERANLEEDAGKNTHPAGADYSLVDLNRAGTPLLEIVSMPDIHSAAEAKAYARELWLTMKYAGVTDGDLYHGHMRFDINVSVSKDSKKLGTRSEIKNLNSFRSVEGAVAYEIKRQVELLEKSQKVVQETRGWDEAKQKSLAQRGKEEAEDYRYMPEPDIPPVELVDKYVRNIENKMPDLPPVIRMKLREIDVDNKVIEEVLDRPIIVPTVLEILGKNGPKSARLAIFWILHPQLAELETKQGKLSQIDPDWKKLKQLTDMVNEGKLSSNSGRIVFKELIYGSTSDWPKEIAKRLKLLQVSDQAEMEKMVAEVISQNPKVVKDIKAGQEKAIGFLVGQVMAKTGGQANPGLAQQLIKKQLGL